FASSGLRRDSSIVTRVEDFDGRALYRRQPSPALRVVSPQVAYLITDILADNHARAPAFGENSPLRLSRPAAAKTGTTSDFRDNWTVGYTPDLAVGVWVGNADNRSMRDVSGISGAAPLWHDFMEEALKTTPARGFSQPPGLVREEICEPTGLKPSPWCPERRLELFIAGTAPTSIETYYHPAPACLPTGQSGSEECPPGSTGEKVFTFVPEEAMAWASAAGLPLPQRPAYQAAPPGGDPASLWVRLASPGPGEALALSREIPLESQQLVLEALAGGPTPVTRVELYDNGNLVETLRQAPYRAWWRLTPGEHSFRAVAYDGQGHRSESAPAAVTVLP
ncbi:MAG: penicillin-binding protein, partial [Dehalococcoidia bacterium]|nr:penicillin-binding protein [Dehalococcoidia bacterium]